MNNEPVAWMNPVTLECGLGGNVDWEDTGCIPLYTHSAKTLTDEEILEIADQFKEGEHWKSNVEWVMPESDFINFARAILKKAQGD